MTADLEARIGKKGGEVAGRISPVPGRSQFCRATDSGRRGFGDSARLAACLVGLFIVVALIGVEARAQAEAPKHYLTFQVGLVGEAVSRNDGARRVTNLVVADRLSGRVEIRSSPSADGVTWSPLRDGVKIESHISEARTAERALMGEGGVTATETRTESYAGNPTFDANFVNAAVRIRPEAKSYDFQFTLMADMATTLEAVRQTESVKTSGALSLGGGRPPKVSSAVVPLQMGPAQLGLPVNYDYLVIDVKNEPLDPDYGFLSGGKRIPVPKPAGWNGSWSIALDVSWQIDATRPPVELIVTVDGYANWRPEGSIKEPAKPGNGLTARATLVPKGDVPTKDLPKVKTIRFELLDTSREPGICLNWPLGAKDSDYDLRLAAVAGGTLSKSDQALEIADPKKNEKGQPYAEVKIDSYDFGARASLRAVCLLTDGREIEGIMKDDGAGQTMVRLPKMKAPGWIAESWRKTHHAESIPEDADEENVEDQKHNGDGYTLYEEYRGWAVNGKHVEGDPKRKDFFVLNRIGGDAQNGINLFERLSKLRVHSKLKRGEMSQTTRLMNGNHRDAPHRVDQHGVWVKTFTRAALGDNGADTPMTKAGVAGRPGITKGVGILERGDTVSNFNKPFNLPARDTIFAYDRAIAHELLHSVGVEHHGSENDQSIDLLFISSNDPSNRLGRPYFATTGGTVFHVISEESHDVAVQYQNDFGWIIKQANIGLLARYLTKARGDFAVLQSYNEKSKYASPEAQAEVEFFKDQAAAFAIHGLIGVQQGPHSGDQDCVMRYYFAKFYEAKGRKDTLYVVTPGTERIGIDVCHSGTGTGINAAGHRPQSRYGNAAAGDGDCFSQICPNDAIPPRKVK